MLTHPAKKPPHPSIVKPALAPVPAPPPENKRATTPVDVYIGQRIRMARLASEMSQTAIADGCGVSFQQIQKYENGQNRVSMGRLMQIGIILGKPAAWFFENAPQTGDDPAVAAAASDMHEFMGDLYGAEIARVFMDLKGREQRRTLRDLVVKITELLR